jgi:hypothetical protein
MLHATITELFRWHSLSVAKLKEIDDSRYRANPDYRLPNARGAYSPF